MISKIQHSIVWRGKKIEMEDVSSTIRPAYTDSKGCRWDTNDAEVEGMMVKRSKWLGELRERFFVLKGSKIFFGKTSTEVHGMIDLCDCISVKSVEDEHMPHAIQIVLKDESFLVSPQNTREQEKWVKSVQNAVTRIRSQFHE